MRVKPKAVTFESFLLIATTLVASINIIFAQVASNSQNAGEVLQATAGPYSLEFSTYFGGNDYEHARDVFVDSQGSIYVVGGSRSTNFPITLGSGLNTGSCPTLGSGGRMDAFIAKFTPSGQLIWSRLLGGPCYDRAYAVEVDSQGSVYIAGRAGMSFPTTSGVFQQNFNGVPLSASNLYGAQNCFVAKLASDGNLTWAGYAGQADLCRDLDLDSQGSIYVPFAFNPAGGTNPSSWLANAFQATPRGSNDSGAMKISNDGTRVIWATYLGGSGYDQMENSLRVASDNSVYLTFSTSSNDIPTTQGAFDRTLNGGQDGYIARLSADGSQLIFGTYIGGSNDDNCMSTHNLALDLFGNAYASCWTRSTNFPITSGAFQSVFQGGTTDAAIVKLSPQGQLLSSTYLGGNNNENLDGIYTDSQGNVYVSGSTLSSDFPVTQNAYQSVKSGGEDATLTILSSDFRSLLYSTFLGGFANDLGRSGFLDGNGYLYVVGSSDGGGWPTRNPYQASYAGGAVDNIIAKLTQSAVAPTNTPTPIPSATPTLRPSVTPVPTLPGSPSPTQIPVPTDIVTPTSALPSIIPLPGPSDGPPIDISCQMGLINGIASIKDIECLYANIVSAIISFAGILLFVMLIYGGFKYMSSGGNPESLEMARKTLTNAIKGIVIISLSYLVLTFIETLTGVNLTIFRVAY